VHDRAEADIVAAADDHDRAFDLVEQAGKGRLPGGDRFDPAGIEDRHEARRAHVDALDVVDADAVFLEHGPQVQITRAAESDADFAAFQVGDGFDVGAGPGGDADDAVTGRLGIRAADIADDTAKVQPALERCRQVGEGGGGEIDLAGAQ
jgi:hypothetical protein